MKNATTPSAEASKNQQKITTRLITFIAVGAVAAAGLSVYSATTADDGHELTSEEAYSAELETEYDLAETDRHLTDAVQPLTFSSTVSLPAEESMKQLDAFLAQYSPNGFADYWTLRQFLSGNIQQVSDITGSQVTLTSPNNIGGDDIAILSDGVTECSVFLQSLSYNCLPIG